MWEWHIVGEFRGWKSKYCLHTRGFTAYGLTKKLMKNITRLFEYVDWIPDPIVKMEFMYGVANKCNHKMGHETRFPKAVFDKLKFSCAMPWFFSETKEFLIKDLKAKKTKKAEAAIEDINRSDGYNVRSKENQLRVLKELYEEYQIKV